MTRKLDGALSLAIGTLLASQAGAQVHPEKPVYAYEKCYGVARQAMKPAWLRRWLPVRLTIEHVAFAATVQVDIVAAYPRLTRPFSYLGLPVLALPCGFAVSGVPIGCQLVGPPSGEGRLLALAHRFQLATEWHRRAPALSSAS